VHAISFAFLLFGIVEFQVSVSSLILAELSIQLYGLAASLHLFSAFQLFEFLLYTKDFSGTESRHCGSETGFFQLFGDLGQLRVCAGQVNDGDFFV
jgi:hypothetical protein